jgi:EAL domain-containing protein (putative c-di-GMP-specific phosphodiesterase class I)
LTVEITEGTALSADCLPVLNELRALGVGVALDDFGTGFASLTHVTSLPITQLKIDRSFVEDLIDRDGDALIAAVLALGRHLDLEVVAEGVETEAQRDRLEELGCLRAQGYLFARPMTIDALRVHMALDEPRLRLLPG